MRRQTGGLAPNLYNNLSALQINPLAPANTGSYLSFATNAFGLSTNNATLAAATTMWCKMKLRTNVLRLLGASDTGCLWQVSSSTLATNIKWEFHFGTDGSSNIFFNSQIPGTGGFPTTAVVNTTFPANGSDIIVYADWTATTAQQIQVYTAAGSNIAAASKTNATNLGLLPAVAGAGCVFLNTTNPASKVLANLVDGIAFGSGGLAAGLQFTKPAITDTGFIVGWLFNDGVSGGSLPGGNTMTFTGTVSSVPGGTW